MSTERRSACVMTRIPPSLLLALDGLADEWLMSRSQAAYRLLARAIADQAARRASGQTASATSQMRDPYQPAPVRQMTDDELGSIA